MWQTCVFDTRVVVIILLFVTAVLCESSNAGLNATQQIKYFGYPLEIHEVTTTDGYILELHRIPYGRNGTPSESGGKPVAFFMHGIYCTSGVFVINHRNRSLPYILADSGYDVWLGNQRGTPFSMRHVSLDARRDKERYWNFTITELGVNDLPAMIDYAVNVTGQRELYYVGHSQGTLVAFIMLAERPEYNNIVKVASMLAPISYMKHFPTLFSRALIEFCAIFQGVLKTLGVYHLGVSLKTTTAIQQTLPPVYKLVFFYLFGGVTSKIFDRTLFPSMAAVLGGDVALKVLVHYDQLYRSGRFGYYDYGKSGNLVEYGQATPPEYSIGNITAPLVMFYAPHDRLVSTEDVSHLTEQLPNLIFLKEMSYQSYSHFDFLWSTTVNEDVFDQIIQLIQQY